jgi:TRAP-type C4-dicarboxylate transport system permease small subunit
MADTPEPAPPRGPAAALARGLALLGGAALLATALLSTVSVLRRWLAGQPVPGDFELVSLGAGISVMGFLAHGTLMRTNILVDSFTSWLPRRATRAIDGLWMLAWCGVAAVLAERLSVGARETLRSGTTTMVLGLPTWWAVGLGAVGFAATAAAALYWAARLLRGRG